MWMPSISRFARLQRAGAALLAAGLLAASAACTGEAQLRTGVVFDYPVTYVSRPPPRYWYYPQRSYRGRPAYLIRGRWYYSTPRGWVVFRREPVELRRYREQRSAEPRRERRPRYLEQPRQRRGRGAAQPPIEQRRRRYSN